MTKDMWMSFGCVHARCEMDTAPSWVFHGFSNAIVRVQPSQIKRDCLDHLGHVLYIHICKSAYIRIQYTYI